MNENENLAAEEAAENVEEITTEQSPEQVEQIADERPEKVYTEEEFNRKLDESLKKKIARHDAKIRKDYEKKYGSLEHVLKAGTGKNDVGEIAEDFRQFYESKGVQIPTDASYSERDIEILARAEADEIIKAGLEDVIEEVDRLADIGVGNMTQREKQVFKTLAEYRKTAEQAKELSRLGVSKDVYSGKEFRDFAGKFNSNTSITEIYEMYSKMQPQKEVRTMGSMKSQVPKDTGVKDFYTREEALQFTKKDFDNNPELFKAVERSMTKW